MTSLSKPGQTNPSFKYNACDLYQLYKGEYRHSLKSQDYPQLEYARTKNCHLPYSTCNQLLKSNQSSKQQSQTSITIYHPLIVLSPRYIDVVSNELPTKQKSSLMKSFLTAQSDQLKIHSCSNPAKNSFQKFILPNLDNIIAEAIQDSSITLLIRKNKKSQDLKQSRLMHFLIAKANQSGIKTFQIPLGYQKQNLKSDSNNSFKNLLQAIQLPEPQLNKSKINYSKKLVTLFSLKNSQSKDDLFGSIYSHNSNSNQESVNLRFSKNTQSNIMSQKDQFDFCSQTSNRIIKNDQKQILRQPYQNILRPTDTKNSLKQTIIIDINEQSNHFTRNFQKTQKININQGDQPKPKQIRGLKKKKHKLSQQTLKKQKRLETPKFGNNFSFK